MSSFRTSNVNEPTRKPPSGATEKRPYASFGCVCTAAAAATAASPATVARCAVWPAPSRFVSPTVPLLSLTPSWQAAEAASATTAAAADEVAAAPAAASASAAPEQPRSDATDSTGAPPLLRGARSPPPLSATMRLVVRRKREAPAPSNAGDAVEADAKRRAPVSAPAATSVLAALSAYDSADSDSADDGAVSARSP